MQVLLKMIDHCLFFQISRLQKLQLKIINSVPSSLIKLALIITCLYMCTYIYIHCVCTNIYIYIYIYIYI